MKRLLPLLTLSALLAFTGKADAQTAVCKDLTVQLDASGHYALTFGTTTPALDQAQLNQAGIFNGNAAWQSFTAGVDGVLHSVSLDFSANYIPTSTATLNIYSGEGIGGLLLAQMTYTNATVFNGPFEFVIDETINLLSGSLYTLQLIDNSAGPFSLRQQGNGALYADGISNVAGKDLVFSTQMLQRPDIDNGSTAPVGLASFGVNISTFDCTNVGTPVTVTLTATDNASSTSTCTSIITVEDNDDPIAVCKNISVALDAAGNATITATDVNNGSSDNCSVSLSVDITAFDCSHVGSVNTVTLTVTDPGGNTDDCTSTVTVVDNTAPIAACKPHTLVLGSSGLATLTVAHVNDGSTDNCGIASRSISKSSFNCGNLGTNTVVLTITDVNGLSSTCNATVTVEDNQSPTIVCPLDILVCSTNNSGTAVAYVEPSGVDNCNVATVQTDASGLTNGSIFPIGTTVQTWTATDIAGHVGSCSFNITVDASPIADFAFSPTCEGESTFFTDLSTIDPSSSIVSWTWNMGDGSGPVTLVDPIHHYADTGLYAVTLAVISTEGCVHDTTMNVHVTPVPTAAFTFVTACEGDAVIFTNTSTIDAGNLNYVWDFGDSNTSTDADPSHIFSVDGTYTVTLTVTSDNGCQDITTRSVTVKDAPNALFTATEKCEGMATTFTNLSTGGGTLSYSWDFGDSSPASTLANPTYTYAIAGTYTVVLTVTNNLLCSDQYTALVTVNPLPTIDYAFLDACEGTPVTFTNNSTPGSTTWDFGDLASSTLSSPTHTYSTYGFYDVTLTVTDANFCINSNTQQIEIFDLPNFTLNATDVLCFGDATGELVAVAVPPAASPWSLSINGNTPQASVTFAGLTAGAYDITAFDANGCEFTVSGTVAQPAAPLGIHLTAITNILCHGDGTGAIDVAATGGTGAYTYAIDGNPAQATGTFNNLTAGSYAIQIVDHNACVFDTIIILTEPSLLELTLSASNDLLCNGDNSGNLTVAGTGGVSPYVYNINSGAYTSAGMFDGLAAGMHNVGVMDANGCTATLQVTLDEPGILMLSVIATEDAKCFGALNGSIEVQAASGTAPYQYSLTGVNFQGVGLFQGLAAATYTVVVKDANGCLDEVTESIFEPSLLTIETNSTPVSCFGDDDGTIQITAGGGTASYTYSIDGGATFGPAATFSGLDGANYLTIVKDGNGCTASEGVVISEPTSAFHLNAIVTNVSCMGDATGSVLLVGTGGTPTYTYSDNNIDFVTSNVISGFATGNFTVYAQDLHGCTASASFFVDQPSSAVTINNTLLVNPACPNQASGAVTVQASGGTPGYMYSSNNGVTFQSSQILSGIGGGNSLIVVKDAKGCIDVDTITLISPPIISLAIDTIIHVACEGDVNGTLQVTALGGTPSYSYRLNGGSIQTNGNYPHLSNGNYVVSVMDVNGCPYSETFSINAAQMLPVASFNITVSGSAVLFQNTSVFGTTYSWQFGDDSTSTEVSPAHVYAQPGEYNVTLTVTNSCGSNTISVPVSTLSIGIADAAQTQFSLYPNPATTELYLTSQQNVDEETWMEVVSVTGRIMYSQKLNSIKADNRTRIDVSNLAQGVYFLRIASANNRSVLRFDIIK